MAEPSFEQRRFRADPTAPVPSSFPQMQDSILQNGVDRTPSKSRRHPDNGSTYPQTDSYTSPPTAPEVPKVPPSSYRPPQSSTTYDQFSNFDYPASFAKRARRKIITGKPGTDSLPETLPSPTEQTPKRERRASLNRPIGGVYTEIRQHKRDSTHSTASGPNSPRRSSLSPRAQQPRSTEITSQSADQSTPTAQPAQTSSPISSQSTAKRRSPLPEQPARKEWASDRSPLQKLEVKLGDISKEEKRARVEQAEERLRRSKASGQRDSRNLNPPVDRTSSRRVIADPSRSRTLETTDAALARDAVPTTANGDIIDSQQKQSSNREGVASRSARTGEHPPRVSSNSRRDSEGVLPTSNKSDESSRRASGNRSSQEVKTQPERGVRFQPQNVKESTVGAPAGLDSPNSRTRQRNLHDLDLDPQSAEARAARREQLRHEPINLDRQSAARQSSSQQQATEKNGEAPTSMSMPIQGSVSQSNPPPGLPNNNVSPKYDIVPPTAAGIAARQKIGFGAEPTEVDQNAPDKKHRFSHLLHRPQNKVTDHHEHSVDRPQTFDEWRRAGVARLTAADFSDETENTEDQGAWWESNGSNRRRRSQRNSRSAAVDIDTQQAAYQGNNGKEISSFVRIGFSSPKLEGAALQARSYLQPEDPALNQMVQSSGWKDPVSSFLRRLRKEKAVASSAYSYSCPNLAYHNPLHSDHICEPYLSKELIQSMRSIRTRPVPVVTTFTPPLYLKCGPLLRYTGMKRVTAESDRAGQGLTPNMEMWRGSVMIVTTDTDSSYEPAPTLRLFPEPMELVPPPPEQVDAENPMGMPSEFIDPIAGLPKLSRTGKTVYVKPVDDLEEAVDLSHVENDDGLFEETRTAAVPTSYGTPDYHNGRNGAMTNKMPQRRSEARKAKRGHRVRGVRLHAERGVTFWRFNLEVELGDYEARIAYSINGGPAIGFWVPAKGQTMNVMFHSCNGFSLSVNPDDFSGPDPLWRDVLNSHQARPFHVMIGGGDQIYNDAVMNQSPLFREWLETKNPHHKHEADFTPPMQEELETFYLEHYSMWFSQGLFGMANSQIPMVNVWDDHDIIDGFGSYPHHFMSTPVFCGVGAVAFKYYMLFQHQSVSTETSMDEPSWLLGAAPGPYITELSRSIFVSLGRHVAFLGLDCRTERMRDEVLSEATYDIVFDRCKNEMVKGETRHLIVLLGVPIAYPRLVWLENLLTSRVLDPVKALGRVGLLGNFLNKFDGGVEILDDLDDHWTARNHKQERNWFIEELQELAADLSVRITILGGDVHLAAIGQFFSNPKLKIRKDHDHRYMANIISSAIVNTPPPEMMGDILNKRNKTHHLDPDTDENMIPMFTHDVDGKGRKNKRLLPRRNWCSIREYLPGSTPPPTPPVSEPESEDEDYSPPPVRSRIQRTMSLTREDVKPRALIRRLSGRGAPPVSYVPPVGQHPPESPPAEPEANGETFQPRGLVRSLTTPNEADFLQQRGSAPLPRPGNFHRMPTNMTEKAVLKGETGSKNGHINLEHGLDIVLNCEVNQRDPAGITTPYRLLIPALWYEGPGDLNTTAYRRQSVLSRLSNFRGRRKSRVGDQQGSGNWAQESESDDDSNSEEGQRPRRWSFGLTQRRQYRDQTPPQQRELNEHQERDIGPGSQSTTGERPQQQRQYEDRSQQIGQSATSRLASRQQALAKLTGQHDGIDESDRSTPRRDSLDYHEHIDSGRPQQANDEPPARKLSKVDRMLGLAGGGRRNAKASSTATSGLPIRRTQSQDYDSDEYDDADDYTEKRKSWKRFFS